MYLVLFLFYFGAGIYFGVGSVLKEMGFKRAIYKFIFCKSQCGNRELKVSMMGFDETEIFGLAFRFHPIGLYFSFLKNET